MLQSLTFFILILYFPDITVCPKYKHHSWEAWMYIVLNTVCQFFFCQIWTKIRMYGRILVPVTVPSIKFNRNPCRSYADIPFRFEDVARRFQQQHCACSHNSCEWHSAHILRFIHMPAHWTYLYTKRYTVLVCDIKLLIPLFDPWLW